MYRSWILVLVIGGCYRPQVEGICEVGCEFGVREQCPNGLQCGADNLCYDETPCDELPDGGGTSDSDIDTITAECFQTVLMGPVCPTPGTVRGDVVYGADPIDTNNSATCTETVGPICLIAAETIVIMGDVRVTGLRPLALYGRLSVTVIGRLDLSAGGAGVKPDILPDSCESPSGSSQATASQASGGGAGGTMVARGGDGGEPNGAPLVVAPPPTTIMTLRAGCAGGRGGNRANGGVNGGTAGVGGGAVQIISQGLVDIVGIVDAYGGGGGGGNGAAGQASGGGGGGSGGLIAIDAATIVIRSNAIMRAHGGGGGGGADASNTGGAGAPATGTNGTAATGGTGSGSSADGGTGSSDGSKAGGPGTGVMGAFGAGGGGGAAGAILLHSTNTTTAGARIHPLPP